MRIFSSNCVLSLFHPLVYAVFNLTIVVWQLFDDDFESDKEKPTDETKKIGPSDIIISVDPKIGQPNDN